MSRVFAGARPTGKLHIGNYLGAIQNFVALQQEHDCVYCIVDIHALTTLDETSMLQENIKEMLLDWLAAGLDPQKSILFVQSHVPQVMELHTLLSMVTPLSWLLRVPTFKEKAKMQPQNVNYGLVGYPVLMTSDIVLYKAELVPVGEDQIPHLELAREIVRRFNSIFGPVFPEPKPQLSEAPMVLGIDGQQKMSKSLNNHIEIAATPAETKKRAMMMVTDPQRIYRHQPGRPEVCNVYRMHQFFSPNDVQRVYHECTHATIGCVQDKEFLGEQINKYFAPFRQRRQEISTQPHYTADVLADGARRASVIAQETLREVKEKMGLLARNIQ